MAYLTDHRGDVRSDPRALLPEARSILCVGKLYNAPHPHTDPDPAKGWISRYAWGEDYHALMREALERVAEKLTEHSGGRFAYRICVDTAPLLERSYARSAGLGWIGRNTCVINQEQGSWFFLGEILLALDLAPDSAPPDRCGTCTRCIDACPTAAIVPGPENWTVDARRCISYLTIEKRGDFNDEERAMLGNHIFGCDICQDVCPWNQRAPVTFDERFWPRPINRELTVLSQTAPEEFQSLFRKSPVKRAKYAGFMRNVGAALGCLLLASGLFGAADPVLNPGFTAYYNLDYDGALRYFEAQLKANPNDLPGYNDVAETILYRQMYRQGELTTSLVDASNSFLKRPRLNFTQADRNEFNRCVNHVLSYADNAKDANTLYAVGVAYGLQATFFFGDKEYISALKSATAANRVEEEALAKDPGLADAHLIPGVYKYVAGSLPFYLRMLSFLGGFQGSVPDGIQELEQVRQHGTATRYDAEVLLAAIYRREHQPGKSIALLKAALARFPHNPLLKSELAAVQRESETQEAQLQH